MLKKHCLGCHTYFQQGEKVPLQSISIQFKNYTLPIKEPKPKWILLKTMVGFLNSKGGTIYIGIQDNHGKVIGQELTRKERDQFLLFVKSLADKIIPHVDFTNKEEVNIVYVPVVSSKKFKGKYVIKIIVKQGETSKTYHFNQVIQLNHRGKIDSYQIPHAFYRHNMGGVAQIKGEELIAEIARKVISPNQIANTFHMFCNPKPLILGGPLTKIGFSGIRRQDLRQKLEELFHNNLQSFDVEYELTYDIQNQVLLIALETQEQFKQINKYVHNSLNQLNSGIDFNFIDKGEYLDLYLYKNIGGKRSFSSEIQNKEQEIKEKEVKEEEVKEQKRGRIKYVEKEEYVQFKEDRHFKQFQDLNENEESQRSDEADKGSSKSCKEKGQKMRNNQEMEQTNMNDLTKCFSQRLVITVTHIVPYLIDQLSEELIKLTQTSPMITRYLSTLELTFNSLDSLLQYYRILMQKYLQFASFGTANKLVIGVNSNKLVIRKYNMRNRKELKLYIKDVLKDDSSQIQFKKSNNKFFLEITFKTPQLTCEWLDKLMNDKNLQQFQRPNSEKYNRMRMYLYCKCN